VNGTSRNNRANGDNAYIPPQTSCHKGFYLDGGNLYVLVRNVSFSFAVSSICHCFQTLVFATDIARVLSIALVLLKGHHHSQRDGGRIFKVPLDILFRVSD
jgi:hypothetical protein